MPEIGEVARIVHFIRKNLVGHKLKNVVAAADDIVYGKVGTSAGEVEKHLRGKRVVDVGQQGKYFWMVMSSPPHPLMHFGMAGWMKFQGEHTFYYRPKPGEENAEEEWPPKYWKFHVETEAEGKDGKTAKAAFVDKRRLARVRLIDCDGKDIRNHDPLNKNGPDPVVDKDKVTLQWLSDLCHRKKVPIKAMLLDQANISGIGNWVGDEVLYHAKIHPEQYANTLKDDQIKQLHENIHYVCGTACELLAETDQFPEHWLFKYRWDKGKKNSAHTLPNGEKIVFLTVGGRTSAVVPSVQKKTGPVAKDIEEAEADADSEASVKEEQEGEQATKAKPKKSGGRKRKIEESEDSDEAEAPAPKKTARGKKVTPNGVTQDKSKAKAKVEPKTEKETKTKTKTKTETEAVNGEEKQPAKKKAKKADVKTEEPAEETKSKANKVKKGDTAKQATSTNGASTTRRRSLRNQK